MKRLELLDYARLTSATAVLGVHYFSEEIINGTIRSLRYDPSIASMAKYGYLGVEMFFIISGYVIFFSAKGRSAGEFVAARALRLYPTFWFCVLLSACVLVLASETITVRQLALNLTMVPRLLHVDPLDGSYWTLMHELAFYSLVAAALAVGLRKHLDTVFLVWPLTMVIAFALGRGGMPIFGAYYPFFAAGALFAMLRERVRLAPVVCLAAMFVLCAMGAVDRAIDAEVSRGIRYSSLIVVSIIAAQFAFFLLLNTRRAQRLRIPGSRMAGSLTYPLYLVHLSIGVILLNRFGSEEFKWTSYAATIGAVFVLALIVHRLVERKMYPLWSALFDAILRRPIDGVLMVLVRI